MRYLILSDIHGGSLELEQALSFFKKLSCDQLVLLGDLLNHGPRNRIPSSYAPMDVASLLNPYKEKIIAVRGNCDGEVDQMVFPFPCTAPYGWISFERKEGIKRIFLTHGHLYRYETDDERERMGLKKGDIVLSGHTHISGVFEKASGVINVNPGSTTLPKGGTQAGFAFMSEDIISLYNLNGDVLNTLSSR